MRPLERLLPNVPFLRLDGYKIDESAAYFVMHLSSTQTIVPCPICSRTTQRVHSRYERTLADLPCTDFRLVLVIHVGKFFCLNDNCYRRIFTERLPQFALPWARKTERFVDQIRSIALALGGAAGARLGHTLGYRSSGSSLLSHLQRLPLRAIETPKAVGIDDFAFRKGHHYGTIIVNLETHQPIALLADRKAETLAAWLQAHPGIEVCSRDRSNIYKKAMTQGAPTAIQVADRFHLVTNLSEVLERALGHYRSELKTVEQMQQKAALAATEEKTVMAKPKPTATEKAQRRILANQKRRIKQQQVIKAMRAQNARPCDIVEKIGLCRSTVERYARAADFPRVPARRPTFGRSLLSPYQQQLLVWWNEGIRGSGTLLEMLVPLGYEGTLRTLQRYISRLRGAQGLPTRTRVNKPLPKVKLPKLPPFTPRLAAYLLILKPENRQDREVDLLRRMTKQHPDLALLVGFSSTFLQIVRQQQADRLDDWLEKVSHSSIKPLQTFAKGLVGDYEAVKASMSYPWSNGPVEGLNNKLKMLKRQMYGRASVDLLAKRLIACG